MRSTLVLWVLASVAGAGAACPAAARQRDGQRAVAERAADARLGDLGPEMQAYMGFLEGEQEELEHLYDVGEVPASEYRLAKDRLAATREAALRVGRTRRDDVVPDLYVLVESELTQVLPEGSAALRGKRAGSAVDADWMYHGTIRKGRVFYVLERTGGIGRDPAN
jgi:hypothetical protein